MDLAVRIEQRRGPSGMHGPNVAASEQAPGLNGESAKEEPPGGAKRQKTGATAAFREIFAQCVLAVLPKAIRKTLNWRSFQGFKNGNWFERGRARLLSDSEQRLQA